MLNNKRYLFIPLVLIVFLAVGLVYNLKISPGKETKMELKADADWVDHYESIDELTEKSDLVVLGQVTTSVPELRVDVIFTKQNVAINKYLKGDKIQNDAIQILQTGGELSGKKTPEIDDAPLFQKNDNLLLFLKKTTEGHYLVMGGYQGVGKFVNDKIEVNVEQDKIGKELKAKSKEEVENLINNALLKEK